MIDANWLLRLSLIRGPFHAALEVGALVALACLLAPRKGVVWWRRRLPLAGASAAALLAGTWLWITAAHPWPDALPAPVIAWVGAGLLGITLAVARWRGQRWALRGLGLVAVVLVLLGAADGIDTVYGAYPTVATALQVPPHDAAPAGTVLRPALRTTAPVPGTLLWKWWSRPAGLPGHGAVTEVTIPPTRSHVHVRSAWIYLPPAYFAPVRPRLPVLMLISGQPGGPRNWLDGGALAEQADAWANAHGGLAPVVVMPDALGSPLTNPLCMDSALGKFDTYLSQDVVRWVTTSLQVDPDHAHWAVGGLSSGGTCALQLAVAHPDVFPTFVDASGQREPTLGSRALTVARTFGGNEAAFTAVDPLHELGARRYPTSAGFLVVGAQDRTYGPQVRTVAQAARAAGMSITYTQVPGGHTWSVWRAALGEALTWLGPRLGLAP